MATLPLIHKKDVIIVKPAEPSPSEILSLSTIDNDRNLELLCPTLYVYEAKSNSKGSNIYKNSDPALVIKEALSRVLIYYYPLAGKLKRENDGKLRINCNANGVPFLEANADCELSSLNYLDGIDTEIANLFAFEFPSENSDCGYHPLVLQVTKFSCGGFTIGMGLSHSVCDGFGAAQFFRAMGELASGKSEPSVKPVWEREKLVGKASDEPFHFPIDKACLATSPFLPTTNVVHESFYVDGESIRRLKINLSREIPENNENFNFTTLEALGAYIWRARFRALKLNPDGKTMFYMAMGIRNLLNPPLRAGYYGNAFLSSPHLALTGRDLDEWPLSKVAKLIKERKKEGLNANYVEKTLNMLETMVQQNLKVEGDNGASLVLTDWRQLGLLEEVDFGWNEMVNMVPLPWNMFFVELCIFLPPCRIQYSTKGKDGVRVLVSLPRAAMERLKVEMEGLQLEGDNKCNLDSSEMVKPLTRGQ